MDQINLLDFNIDDHAHQGVRIENWPVKVSNTSGAGNGHFYDLQMTANNVSKAEKTSFSSGNAIQSHY